MKKTISFILSLLIIMSFAPCLGEAEKTVVSIVTSQEIPSFEARFEELYPDIDLQVEDMRSGVINGELTRRARKGHAPDLLVTNLPGGELVDYTYDLSAQPFSEAYQSTITKLNTIDGQVRWLPLPGTYCGYILNKTLLDEMGLPLPETTADLLDILAAAKEKNIGVDYNGYGFGLADIGANFIGAYLTANFATNFLGKAEGAMWLAALEGGNATFTGTWESSVDFMKACIDAGYVDAEKIKATYKGQHDTDANSFKAEERMPAREAILSYGDVSTFEKIQALTEDEIVMLPCLPDTADGQKLLSAVSNNYIGVNAALEGDDVRLNAALSVLEFLSTAEGQTLWMNDTYAAHSYLTDCESNMSLLPEEIQSYVTDRLVFTNPFPTGLMNYLGKMLSDAAKSKIEIGEALANLDAYYKDGSDNVEYDMSIVGTVDTDMIYINSNTRTGETVIGNFISDAIREITGADVVLVNGGSIRSSLYAGDVTGEDLAAVCPYGNLVIISEMDGATLRAAITNGIQKTWKPAGQFLQVSGVKYSFKPAADETETAELLTLTYADGTEIKDDDVFTVAYTNYMGGSQGYVDAGDGFTMLNVYDADTEIGVKLVTETNKTFGDIIKEYFALHADESVTAALEGRIEVVG